MELPEEIILLIFGYLDGIDLLKCSLVCSLFERVSQERKLWERQAVFSRQTLFRRQYSRWLSSVLKDFERLEKILTCEETQEGILFSDSWKTWLSFQIEAEKRKKIFWTFYSFSFKRGNTENMEKFWGKKFAVIELKKSRNWKAFAEHDLETLELYSPWIKIKVFVFSGTSQEKREYAKKRNIAYIEISENLKDVFLFIGREIWRDILSNNSEVWPKKIHKRKWYKQKSRKSGCVVQ